MSVLKSSDPIIFYFMDDYIIFYSVILLSIFDNKIHCCFCLLAVLYCFEGKLKIETSKFLFIKFVELCKKKNIMYKTIRLCDYFEIYQMREYTIKK